MINILKAEFKKFFKTKTFIILIIITLAFPLFTSGLYKILENLIGNQGMIGIDNIISSLAVFDSSFGPLQNYGLILLIFILVLVVNDFTQNTIRNKLIAGYKRTKVYLSSTIFALTIMFVAVTIYAFLSYLLTGLFISFGNETALDIIKAYFLNISSILVIYSFVVFNSYIFKRIGATLGIVLGTLFVIMLAFSIISIGLEENTINNILIVLPFLKIFSVVSAVKINYVLSIIINLVYVAGITGLGILATNKMDFK